MIDFSVIIPVFKAERFLQRCVESVIDNNYPSLEIILVDDGTPDRSGVMCDEIAARHQNITVIHKQNGGPSSARNAGLDIAEGKYIYFLDSDDYVEPGLFDILKKEMDEGYDMVSWGYDMVGLDGEYVNSMSYPLSIYSFNNPKEKSLFIIRDVLKFKFGFAPWNRIFRHSIIDKYNLRFDTGLILAEDLCFLLCYIFVSENYKNLERVLYHYVVNNNGITMLNCIHSNVDIFVKLCKSLDGFVNNTFANKEYHDFLPLLHYEIITFESRRFDNSIRDCREPEKSCLMKMMKEAYYNRVIYELFPKYVFWSINVSINKQLGINKVRLFFERIMRRFCRIFCNKCYIK